MSAIFRLLSWCGVVLALLLIACSERLGITPKPAASWELISASGEPSARRDAALVAYAGHLYLIGGRQIAPVDVFDPVNRRWSKNARAPTEIHSFQAVVVDDAIYLLGAMTGQYPNETPLDRVVIYYPERDEFRYGHEIPEARRRGGAGAVYHSGKIYLLGGTTHDHVFGYRPWLDQYDPKTGEWQVLPDAPLARDHFQAVVLDNKLYAFGGRSSRQQANQVLAPEVSQGAVFDLVTGKWQATNPSLALPTPRAGSMAIGWGDEVIIGGGESHVQEAAHAQVEAYNVTTGQWRNWPALKRGRHGSGFAIIDDYLYTASGSRNRGGGLELTSVERLKLPLLSPSVVTTDSALNPVAGLGLFRSVVWAYPWQRVRRHSCQH